MSIEPLKPVRLIDENDGALLTFDPSLKSGASSIAHAGTLDCHTCVGLYIPITAVSCYIAHINACVFFTEEDGRVMRHRRVCSQAEGERITAEVLKRFERLAAKHKWNLSDAYVREHIADVIMVCPRMLSDDGKQTKLAGWYAVRAIKQFLNLRATAGTLEKGFVVEHRSGGRIDVPWICQKTLSELRFVDPRENEPGGDVGEWYVAVRPDGWVV